MLWKLRGSVKVREREISPSSTLDVVVSHAADLDGPRATLGRAVTPMTDYRDGYPRRLWVKVGDRATGRVSEAWRGAVDEAVCESGERRLFTRSTTRNFASGELSTLRGCLMASPTREDVLIWRARASKVETSLTLRFTCFVLSTHLWTFTRLTGPPEEASEASSRRGVRGVPRRTELAGGARSPTNRRSISWS